MSLEETNGEKYRQKRRLCRDRGRDWSDAGHEPSKECQEPPETGRDKVGFSLRDF